MPNTSAAMPNTPAASGGGARATSTPLLSLAATTATTPTNPSTFAVASVAATIPQPCCDWAVFKCHMTGLPPIKCQRAGCEKFVHHVCSIEWVISKKLPEGGIGTFCREHHPQACHTIRASSTAADASPIANTATMTVSSVPADVRGTSPIVSTANKVNAKTTAKSRVNQKGEVVAAVKSKEVRIGKGVRVFSTKSQLISLVKKGDPQYDVIDSMGNGFRFYGRVIEPDAKKGRWHIEFDLFPTDAKSLRLSRILCTTLRPGEDEPQHNQRNDKIDSAIANMEVLEESEIEDCDILLVGSENDMEDDVHDGEEDENGGIQRSNKKKKKKKKVSKKVESLLSFISMSDEGVLHATTFDHYYGESNEDFIRWDILKEGEEISEDVMEHDTRDRSPFNNEIPWIPSMIGNDYFEIFFKYFFPSLQGKAAVLDKYLSSTECSAHKYVEHDKIKFHQPDCPDPDYLVSSCYCDSIGMT